MAEKRLPCLGEADAAGGAVEKGHHGTALERRHLLRDSGLGVVERLRRSREGAAAGNLTKDPQMPELEHNRTLDQLQDAPI